jgi:hypothetical protein
LSGSSSAKPTGFRPVAGPQGLEVLADAEAHERHEEDVEKEEQDEKLPARVREPAPEGEEAHEEDRPERRRHDHCEHFVDRRAVAPDLVQPVEVEDDRPDGDEDRDERDVVLEGLRALRRRPHRLEPDEPRRAQREHGREDVGGHEQGL